MLQDPERVAACLPGASVTRRQGNGAEGALTLRLGPYTADYTGVASLREIDRQQMMLRVRAYGREREGGGRADALVSVRLTPRDDRTWLQVETDLSIRGMAAKFGAGALTEASTQTLIRFAANVEQALSSPPPDDITPPVPERITESRTVSPAVSAAAVVAAAASAIATYALIRLLRRR
ncbi:hypothetical protein EK0264_04945 [Epidermidibacterium keratini]|uniref:Carbon monoxide dehydrogenase n=1 Tax=Epidermidibacterium keratini TaxID=1891644 RepID=A0A7L4YKV0_9ACTN|nr:hypothetical protein EK0264_04945 [Epidermidibacterium keratini]